MVVVEDLVEVVMEVFIIVMDMEEIIIFRGLIGGVIEFVLQQVILLNKLIWKLYVIQLDYILCSFKNLQYIISCDFLLKFFF